MSRFLLSRLAFLLGTLLAISLLIFVMGSFLPNDAAQMRLNLYANDENLAALRAQLGLDQPLALRYLRWLAGAMQGDFGVSTSFNGPIGPIVLQRLQQSAILTIAAMLLSVPCALLMGTLSGLFRNRLPDHLMTVVGLLGISVPEFVVGVLLITVLADILHLVPAASITDASPLAEPVVLVLPVLTLTLLMLAQVGRLMRSGTVTTLRRDFVRTARLKGIAERRVVLRHVFPNAVPPAISAVGLNFGWMFGSLAVVETLFSFQGLGSLIVFAVQNRDIALLQAAVLAVAVVVCLGNLVADLVIISLDPRLRSVPHGR